MQRIHHEHPESYQMFHVKLQMTLQIQLQVSLIFTLEHLKFESNLNNWKGCCIFSVCTSNVNFKTENVIFEHFL